MADRKDHWTPAEFAEAFNIDVEQARAEHAEARAHGEYRIEPVQPPNSPRQ